MSKIHQQSHFSIEKYSVWWLISLSISNSTSACRNISIHNTGWWFGKHVLRFFSIQFELTLKFFGVAQPPKSIHQFIHQFRRSALRDQQPTGAWRRRKGVIDCFHKWWYPQMDSPLKCPFKSLKSTKNGGFPKSLICGQYIYGEYMVNIWLIYG